jgi:hypothetical protein
MSDLLDKIVKQLASNVDDARLIEEDGKIDSSDGPIRTIGALTRMMTAKNTEMTGQHLNRKFFLTLFACGEMNLSVSCRSDCRFKVIRNSLGARLNFLQGKRVISGNADLDDKYIIRSNTVKNIAKFLQNSGVLSYFLYLRPFYQVNVDPEIVSIKRDFNHQTLNSGDLKVLLERTIELSDQLEGAFPAEVTQYIE